VAGLLALVAYPLGRALGWAITAQVADFTTVVALLSLGAVAGNVTHLATLVALLATGLGVASLACAVAGDVSGFATAVADLVARLVLCRLCALSGDVALSAAVVAGRRVLGRTVTGLVSGLAAVVAGLATLTLLESSHCELSWKG